MAKKPTVQSASTASPSRTSLPVESAPAPTPQLQKAIFEDRLDPKTLSRRAYAMWLLTTAK